MTTDPLDDPIRRQMADRGYTLVPRRTHRYAGENLAVCGAAVPDPCPECGQPDEALDVERLREAAEDALDWIVNECQPEAEWAAEGHNVSMSGADRRVGAEVVRALRVALGRKP